MAEKLENGESEVTASALAPEQADATTMDDRPWTPIDGDLDEISSEEEDNESLTLHGSLKHCSEAFLQHSTVVATYYQEHRKLRHANKTIEAELNSAKQAFANEMRKGEENALKAAETDQLRAAVTQLEAGKLQAVEYFGRGINMVKEVNEQLKLEISAAYQKIESLNKSLAEETFRETCFVEAFNDIQDKFGALRQKLATGGRVSIENGALEVPSGLKGAHILSRLVYQDVVRERPTSVQRQINDDSDATEHTEETETLDAQMLHDEIKQLNQEIEDMRACMEETLKEARALVVEELTEMDAEHTELEKALAEAVATKELSTKEADEAKLRASKAEALSRNFLAQVRNLQEAKDLAEKKLAAAMDQTEIADNRIEKIKGGVEAIQTERMNLFNENQKLRGEKEAAEKRAADAIAQKDHLETASGSTAIESAKAYGEIKTALDQEKSNHMTHVRKVKEGHEKEMKALKSKHLREIEDVKNAKPQVSNLRKQLEGVKVENNGLKNKIQKAENTIRELENLKAKLGKAEAERKSLKMELEKAKQIQKDASCPENGGWQVAGLDGAKEKLARANERCAQLEKELADVKDVQLANFREQHRTKTERLQSRIDFLEKDAAGKAPLVLKGAAVRLRFLAQTENIILGRHRDDTKSDIIQRGNAAAHRGDGTADGALLQTRLSYNSAQFRNVYGHDEELYRTFSKNTKRVMDIQATYLSSAVSTRSTSQRNEYIRLIGKWNETADHEGPQGTAVLDELDAVVEKILQLDRRP